MTQTAPPPPSGPPPQRPWNFQREDDHPTDTAAANPARVRRPQVDVPLPDPVADTVRADDPASIRMQELAEQRAEHIAAQSLKPPLDWALLNTREQPAAVVPPAWESAKQLIDAAKTGTPLPEWARGLEDWWANTAAHDIESSIAKVVEYGGRGSAYDLLATGHDVAALSGRQVGDEEAAELAILFYLSSKVNRWFAAAIDGRRPSDDTLLDITYYAMMARRVRAVGGWPIAPHTEEKHA